jgi:Deoxynucleotide monophosphate kinase
MSAAAATGARLIGLTGRAGSGKSTAAAYLVERHGFTRTRFAGPLKAMLRAMGLSEREIDGDLKEAPCARLCGRTPRQAMQWLGTEWGRDMIHPDLWTELWKQDAEKIVAEDGRVVVDDVRFPDEVALVRSLGGYVLAITEPAPSDVARAHVRETHVSETHQLACDRRVLNEKYDLSLFHARLDETLALLRRRVP